MRADDFRYLGKTDDAAKSRKWKFISLKFEAHFITLFLNLNNIKHEAV